MYEIKDEGEGNINNFKDGDEVYNIYTGNNTNTNFYNHN